MGTMRELHRAAFKRAYRTLAQGLGSSAVTTGTVGLVVALLGQDGQATRAAVLTAAISVTTAILAAVASFWQAVAGGLPEAPKPPTE